MAESVADSRCKNYKLAKQDEVELSDEEAAISAPLSSSPGRPHALNQQQQQQVRPRLGGLVQPVPLIVSPKSSENDRRSWDARLQASSSLGDEAISPGRTVPVASMQIVNSSFESKHRDSLPPPKHLGSMAFSSMSTDETSSICDTEALSRHLGSLSVQESLQDDLNKKDASTLEFLISTWHQQPQDRLNMLRFEKTLEGMLEGNDQELRDSQPLNSYYRMLLHRMAEVWDFEHNTCYIKGSQAQGVSLKQTLRSARPDHLFREMPEPIPEEPDMGKVILQRPKTHSGQTEGQFKTHKATTGRNVQSLSLQERQANYDEVRQRIFGETEEIMDAGDAYPYRQETDMSSDRNPLSSSYRRQYSGSRGAGRNYNAYSGQEMQSMLNYGNSPFGDASCRPDVNGGMYPYGTSYGYYMPQAPQQPLPMGMEAMMYGQGAPRPMQQQQQHNAQAGSYFPSMAYPGHLQQPHFLNMYATGQLPSAYGQPMYLPEEQQYQQQMGYVNSVDQQQYQNPMLSYANMTSMPFGQPAMQYGPSAPLMPRADEYEGGSANPQGSPVERSLSSSRMSQGPEGPEVSDSMIIPLRLPGVKGERPNMNLGMYLKLPYVNNVRSSSKAQDEYAGDERGSLNSRNSAYSNTQDNF